MYSAPSHATCCRSAAAAAARIAFARGDQLRALEARTAHLYADIHMHTWMDALPLTAAAMRQVGFFYLVGHGVPEQDFDTLYADMTRFFALDSSVKSKVHTVTNPHNRGWTPLGEETLDPERQTCGDTKEGYYIGREIPAGHKLAHLPLHGPNVWPDAALLPEWRENMERYHAHMERVGRRLVRLLALTLGLDAAFFDDKFDEPMLMLRLLHYSAARSEVSRGVYACGEHSDYGMLTLLSTDLNPGLQIKGKDGKWLDVPPRPHALIINLGDMLERWTNGVYRSTPHRVINTTGRERYSAPFFFEPNFSCVVECIESCVPPGEKPKFPPTTSGQHLLDMYNQTHADWQAQRQSNPSIPKS